MNILLIQIALAAHLFAFPQEGLATWYSAPAGAKTASGEVFDPKRLTAAHRTLPFGTCVDVTRSDTGKTVRVRITDRGPYAAKDRIIDLSYAAAARIGMETMGVAKVRLHRARGKCRR